MANKQTDRREADSRYYLALRAARKATHMRYVGTFGNQGPPMARGYVWQESADQN